MNPSRARPTFTERFGTTALVLIAFGAGHVAANLGVSPAMEAALVAVVAAVALTSRASRKRSAGSAADSSGQSSGQSSRQSPSPAPAQASSSDDSSRTVPNGVNTFDVVCSPPASENVLAVIQDVIDGMVRPTDLVVRHTDGRLLLVVDAAGDDVRQSFESRANVHVHVALAAAGMSPVGLTLRPTDSGA